MLALPEFQRAFLAAILAGDAAPVIPLLRDDGIPAARRLQIYRNNARESFLATLRATYPVIEQLGGADWFAQEAGRYQARCPSRCGDLQYVGERFPAFLDAELAGTAYGWFGDVARLEWAYQEVLTAADHRPLDLARLASVPAAEHAGLELVLHPALRTVHSPFPVLDVWRAHRPGAADPAGVDLGRGPSRILLTRQRDHVELRECSPGLFALVRALGSGRPLGRGALLAARVEPGFDLGAGLRRLASLGAFADFRRNPRT